MLPLLRLRLRQLPVQYKKNSAFLGRSPILLRRFSLVPTQLFQMTRYVS